MVSITFDLADELVRACPSSGYDPRIEPGEFVVVVPRPSGSLKYGMYVHAVKQARVDCVCRRRHSIALDVISPLFHVPIEDWIGDILFMSAALY